jgi:hypothetical protein
MHPRRLRTNATAIALDSATLKRIQWLFERVCRHGYGAESSLKCAVQAGATRMSQAGATPTAIRRAIAASVQGHAFDDPARTTFIAAELRVVSIQNRMMAWADAARAADTPPLMS